MLITAYHRFGSLYEFLQVEKIDKQLAIRMINSVLSGLTHLHCGIVGSVAYEGQSTQNSYKVAIAHRDIKVRFWKYTEIYFFCALFRMTILKLLKFLSIRITQSVLCLQDVFEI